MRPFLSAWNILACEYLKGSKAQDLKLKLKSHFKILFLIGCTKLYVVNQYCVEIDAPIIPPVYCTGDTEYKQVNSRD